MVVTTQPSVFRDGFLDVPHEGSIWLNNFRLQNKELLSHPDVSTAQASVSIYRHNDLVPNPATLNIFEINENQESLEKSVTQIQNR